MKILIIKTSALGDILHTFPSIQWIHKIVPEAQIDWVVEKTCASLVEAHPLVNKVHIIETKKWKKSFFGSFRDILQTIQNIRSSYYDVIFDFQGNIKSGIVMGIARSLKKVGFGKKSVAEWPNLLFSNMRFDPTSALNIREDYLSLVEGWSRKKGEIHQTLLRLNAIETARLDKLISITTDGINIMVCPGSNWKNKRLSLDDLVNVLHQIELQKPCKFWILQANEKEKIEAEYLKAQLIDAEVVPNLSLPLLQHFMRCMKQVIAMDSLPLHLAAEANVATYGFFGPSSSAKYRPIGSMHQAFQGHCPYLKTFKKRCSILRTCPTGACLKDQSHLSIQIKDD